MGETSIQGLTINVDLEIAKVWEAALETGANVLALNVLEAAASSPRMIEKRNQLNAMIMNHKEDRLYVYCVVAALCPLHETRAPTASLEILTY